MKMKVKILISTIVYRLVEKLDEDRNVKDHLTIISTILKNLGEENTGKISEIQSNLTLELRQLLNNYQISKNLSVNLITNN